MHSSTDLLFVMQYFLALYVYLFPKVAIRHRRALSPIHMFFGRAAFTAGLATMAVSTYHARNCKSAGAFIHRACS